MADIWLGLLFFCIGWHFYHQRQLAEKARLYIQTYCEERNIQFLSIAKTRSRIVKGPRGLAWQNDYVFEFSGDQESANEGTLVIQGKKILEVNLPLYRTH